MCPPPYISHRTNSLKPDECFQTPPSHKIYAQLYYCRNHILMYLYMLIFMFYIIYHCCIIILYNIIVTITYANIWGVIYLLIFGGVIYNNIQF